MSQPKDLSYINPLTNEIIKQNSKSELEYIKTQNSYSLLGSSMKYGIIGGILLGLFQFFFADERVSNSIGTSMIGVVFLIPVVWWALKEFQKKLQTPKFFRQGLKLGMGISLIAALIMSIFNIATFIQVTSSNGNDDYSKLAVFASFEFLVCLVGGMVVTFIILQGMKNTQAISQGEES